MGTNETNPVQKTLLQRWIGWRGVVVLLVLTPLLTPFLIRAWKLRGVPDFPEPFDTKPILEYRVPDEENAFTEYRKAISLYQQPSETVKELRGRIIEDGWYIDNVLIRDFLTENDETLMTWKKGTTRDRALFLPASEYELDMDLELIQEMRELHGTAMLRCLQLEAEGKPQEAWEWYRAAIRASRHLGTHGGIIERLVGITLFSSSVDRLESWSSHPQIDSESLKLALEQLQTDWNLTELDSKTLKIGYLTFQHSLESFIEEFNTEKGLPAFAPNIFNLVGEPELSRRLSRIHVHNLLMFCDDLRRNRPEVSSTYSVFEDPAGFSLGDHKCDADNYEQAMDRSIVAKMMLPSFASIIDSTDREIMRYQSLRMALAAQAYFRDHGNFPLDAADLVPEYLDEIPDDLYSPTPAPLIYRRDGDGAVVYSRFRNEVDDGGTKVTYREVKDSGDGLTDYGVRIRHPLGKPLRAPKPFSN
ncbi:MAG: type II secretion system protein [Planctomycetaceae bacterium]|nr:type II secretion system protein [Planctomycetaceae bacterium]